MNCSGVSIPRQAAISMFNQQAMTVQSQLRIEKYSNTRIMCFAFFNKVFCHIFQFWFGFKFLRMTQSYHNIMI